MLIPFHVAALEVEVIPAWEGYYKPEAVTEMLVRVSSAVGGELRVTAGDDEMTAVTRITLDPDGSAELVLPVRPVTGTVTITAALGIGAPVESIVNLLPLERPLLAVAVSSNTNLSPWLTGNDKRIPMPVAATALPHTAAGYGPVTELVVTGDTLAQMTPAQRTALGNYLGLCGRVILADPAPKTGATLRAQSGCGDRFVTTASTTAAPTPRLSAPARALPAADALQALSSSPPRLWWLAVEFFAGYAAILVLLGFRTRGRAAAGALLIPVLASALMAATWIQNEPERRLVLWAEQDGDSTVARYQALYDIHSQGINTVELSLPPGLGLPENLSAGSLEIERGTDQHRLRLESRVLARHSLGFSGTFEHHPAFSFVTDTEGPRVTYTGQGDSPRATLAWSGRYYPVPTLRTAESWQPGEDAESVPRNQVPRPLASQGDALLISLEPSTASVDLPASETTQAWLLLRLGDSEHPS